MKILFLDDEKIRHDQFQRNSIRHVVFKAWDVKEACAIIDLHSPFDIIYLDHDLGGKVHQSPGETTGYAVAQYITQLPYEQRPSLVVLHTFNHAGAQAMEAVLTEAAIPTVRRIFGMSNFYADL